VGPDIILKTDKKIYFHYDFVFISVTPARRTVREKLKGTTLYALVHRDNNPVITIGRRPSFPLAYNKKTKSWECKWPVPWNAPDGQYHVSLNIQLVKNFNISECSFSIARRKPEEIPNGMCIVTMENMNPLATMRMKGPGGESGDWKKLLEWVSFSGANTFWYIAGQTSAYLKPMKKDFPWNEDNLGMIGKMAEKCRERKLKFGVWIAIYLTFGPREFAAEYAYAWDYDIEKGGLFQSRGISIADQKRITDVVNLLKKLNNIDGIDYIGLDYIRNVKGGLELVDEFTEEMGIELPAEYKSSMENRMKWLGRTVYRRKKEDMAIIDMWNWYRARKAAHILKRIKEESLITKPLWAFTLSWEKGWQHGQDVVMMNDAGMDFSAVMMYECDREQFNNLIKDWHSYVNKDDVQLVVGNQFDWILHQRTLDPAGPEEYHDRLITSMDRIYSNGKTSGIFIHDMSRILWGRKGPYPSMEWLVSGGAAFTRQKQIWDMLPVKAEITSEESISSGKTFTAKVVLKRVNKKKVQNIKVSILEMEGIKILSPAEKILETMTAEENVEFLLQAVSPPEARGKRCMLAARVVWEGESSDSEFIFKYINVDENDKQ